MVNGLAVGDEEQLRMTPSTGNALSEEKVRSSREAAAAIAAKLKALAPPTSAADTGDAPPDEPAPEQPTK